ncbi:MAG TPA: hypothetical protein VGK67_36295 [Myxococcales bacterium]|jgi:hypothetical protein
MRKLLLLLPLAVAAACASAASAPSGYTPSGSEKASDSAPAQGSGIEPGTLTAGAWDDNLNFDFYLSYLQSVEAESREGIPLASRADRMIIEVADGTGAPLAGAQVEVVQAGQSLLKTLTGADGRALFFPSWEGAIAGDVTVSASAAGQRTEVQAKVGDASAKLALQGQSAPRVNAVDVTLVIDSTGSMGDEMAYLTTELSAIATSLGSRFPGLDQRWGLVFYRDEGDAFLVEHKDFQPATKAAEELSKRTADGGGDYEEVPDLGLQRASELTWRSGSVARMVFHVADAPAHAQNVGRLLQSVKALRAKGVHVYPVAASGVDEKTEYAMRSEAQLTGGRYLFLTDDSGVGGEHKEPTLPCYFVTKLNSAIDRMIQMELTGTYSEPKPEEVLRTGGDPKDGRCTLSDGRVVVAL